MITIYIYARVVVDNSRRPLKVVGKTVSRHGRATYKPMTIRPACVSIILKSVTAPYDTANACQVFWSSRHGVCLIWVLLVATLFPPELTNTLRLKWGLNSYHEVKQRVKFIPLGFWATTFLRTLVLGAHDSWLVTRDISDGVRCDTEVSVDVVSVRSWIRSRVDLLPY
jgi:hypothetical protein